MQSLLRTSFPRFMTGLFVALFALAFSTSAFAAPTRVETDPGNPNCVGIGLTGGELRIDPPKTGINLLIPFVNASGVFITNMDENPNLFLNYTVSANGRVMTSWSIVGDYDRLVSAVIVKGGPGGSNIYYYDDLSAGDIGTFTVPGGAQAISHLSFCFEDFTAPTAVVNVDGMVTNKNGKAISGALVTVTDLLHPENTYFTYTGADGSYLFEGIYLTDGSLYSVTASYKNTTFNTHDPFSVADGEGINFQEVSGGQPKRP